MAHEIVDGSSMQRALTRITYEIIEQNKGVENLVFVGIKTRGVYLAERLAKRLNQLENVEIPVGALDITLYRDDRHIPDHHKEPTVKTSSLGIDINDKHVILGQFGINQMHTLYKPQIFLCQQMLAHHNNTLSFK